MLNLKAKLIALAAGLLAILGFFVRLRVVTNQRDKAKEAATKYKLWSERQQRTGEIDAEIEQEFSRRAQEARKDDKVPDNLSKPNDF